MIYDYAFVKKPNSNSNINLVISDYQEKNYEYLLLNNLVDIFITNFRPKHKALKYKLVKSDPIYIICKKNKIMESKHNLQHNSIDNPLNINFDEFQDKTFYLLNLSENVGAVSKMILNQNNFFPKRITYVPNILSSVSMLDENSATFITESSLTYVHLKKDVIFFKTENYNDFLSIGFIYHKDYNIEFVESFYKSMKKALF